LNQIPDQTTGPNRASSAAETSSEEVAEEGWGASANIGHEDDKKLSYDQRLGEHVFVAAGTNCYLQISGEGSQKKYCQRYLYVAWNTPMNS
jgi:hypothetical protein